MQIFICIVVGIPVMRTPLQILGSLRNHLTIRAPFFGVAIL